MHCNCSGNVTDGRTVVGARIFFRCTRFLKIDFVIFSLGVSGSSVCRSVMKMYYGRFIEEVF